MEESQKSMAHHQQQQQLLLQQQQQQQQQQQLLLFQQLQQQQQAAAQAAAISRFPSNIDAHLRPPGGLHRPPFHFQNQHGQTQQTLASQQQPFHQQNQNKQQQQQQHHHQQQQKVRPNNQTELEMAHQDAWRICHPDFKRPFSSLEDACERLLPYHVVADYEAEEDDRILDSDTTGQMPSRSQQWDHTIATKVAEFTAMFEKQVLAFNIISHKRGQGEFRSEERLMIEQALLQDEKQAILELRAEIESREKVGREAKMRMAIAQAEQARAEAQGQQAQAEMMISRGPMRANIVSQGDVVEGHGMGLQEQGVIVDEVLHGWGTGQREGEEPPEDFLNDENDHENGEAGIQNDWRDVGELDLNSR